MNYIEDPEILGNPRPIRKYPDCIGNLQHPTMYIAFKAALLLDASGHITCNVMEVRNEIIHMMTLAWGLPSFIAIPTASSKRKIVYHIALDLAQEVATTMFSLERCFELPSSTMIHEQ